MKITLSPTQRAFLQSKIKAGESPSFKQYIVDLLNGKIQEEGFSTDDTDLISELFSEPEKEQIKDRKINSLNHLLENLKNDTKNT